jgi:hypothetical protein
MEMIICRVHRLALDFAALHAILDERGPVSDAHSLEQ